MPEQINLEDEIRIAQSAYQERDYEHAAFHLAGALAQDPMNPEALELFDSVINDAPESDELITLSEDNFYGEIIARAYVDAKRGNYASAIDLLTEVLYRFPALEVEKWLLSWLADARFRAIRVNLASVSGFLENIQSGVKDRLRLRQSETAFYQRFVQLAQTLVKFYPEEDNVLTIASNLMRRAGYADDAIRYANDALRKHPDGKSANALGLALRAGGQFNRAVSAFEQAWKRDHDARSFLEMAKTRWDAGGEKAAFKYIRKAIKKGEGLDKDPETNCMLRYLKGDRELLDILGPMARPDDFHLLTAPLVGYLLKPADVSLGYLAEMSPGGVSENIAGIYADCIEPPSVRLALALATGKDYDLSHLDYVFDEVPLKDPRRHTGQPRLQAWRYDETGQIPVQVVDRPDPIVRRLVLKLAEQPYFLPRWWAQARQIMKNNAINLSELISAMVYPPPAPDNIPVATWVVQVQIASALLIAAAEDQWHESLRREILLDLLHGPVDWVTDAVVLALTEVALDSPEALPEIAFEFEELLQRVPELGHWSLCGYLALCYRRLPGRPVHMHNAMNSLLSDYTRSLQSIAQTA